MQWRPHSFGPFWGFWPFWGSFYQSCGQRQIFGIISRQGPGILWHDERVLVLDQNLAVIAKWFTPLLRFWQTLGWFSGWFLDRFGQILVFLVSWIVVSCVFFKPYFFRDIWKKDIPKLNNTLFGHSKKFKKSASEKENLYWQEKKICKFEHFTTWVRQTTIRNLLDMFLLQKNENNPYPFYFLAFLLSTILQF